MHISFVDIHKKFGGKYMIIVDVFREEYDIGSLADIELVNTFEELIKTFKDIWENNKADQIVNQGDNFEEYQKYHNIVFSFADSDYETGRTRFAQLQYVYGLDQKEYVMLCEEFRKYFEL